MYSSFRRWQSAVSRHPQYTFCFDTRHRRCFHLLSVRAATSLACGGWGRWTRRSERRTAQFRPSSVDAGPRAGVSPYCTALVPWVQTIASVVLPADLHATNTVSTRLVWASPLGDWQRRSGANCKFHNTTWYSRLDYQCHIIFLFLFITSYENSIFGAIMMCACVTYRTVCCGIVFVAKLE